MEACSFCRVDWCRAAWLPLVLSHGCPQSIDRLIGPVASSLARYLRVTTGASRT